MAWVSGQPADGSKIRNFPELTRDNFTAIEDGDTSLEYTFLNLSEQASPPSDLASDIRLYGAAGTTYTSLFAHNENGDDIQLTDDNLLGATTQSLALQDLTFDTSDSKYTLDGNFICHAYGAFNAAGTKNALSKNISTTSYSGGSERYTVVTEAIFANSNAICIVTPSARGKTIAPEIVSLSESGGALTIIIKMWNASGVDSNQADTSGAHFMILGGM